MFGMRCHVKLLMLSHSAQSVKCVQLGTSGQRRDQVSILQGQVDVSAMLKTDYSGKTSTCPACTQLTNEMESVSIRITVVVSAVKLWQVAGVRSNLWQGAAAVASGAAFTNVYVGWGVKTQAFLPLPPPPVAQEYDQVGLFVLLSHHPSHKIQPVHARYAVMVYGQCMCLMLVD